MEFALSAPTGFQIERLDVEIHDRDGFSCGVDALDAFLRTQAAQAQIKNLSSTHVVVEAGTQSEVARRPIIGYVTILTGEIPLSLASAPALPKKIAARPAVPIILLARMAVDQRYKRRGFGRFLVKYALKCACEISEMSSGAAVIVDAKDDQLKQYYMEFGFKPLVDNQLRLYIPIATAKELFEDSN